MQETGVHNGAFGADKFGLKNLGGVNWNFGAPQLCEHALRAGEAVLSADGALCADTGVFTGRSPKDKFTVRDATTEIYTLSLHDALPICACWRHKSRARLLATA